MIKVEFYCDICGEKIPSENIPSVSIYEQERDKAGNGDIVANNMDAHLCSSCRDKIIAVISGMPAYIKTPENAADMPEKQTSSGQVLQPELAEPDMHERKPRALVDDDKVKSLWDAGWSVAEIADEIGCSKSTIYKRLNTMGVA